MQQLIPQLMVVDGQPTCLSTDIARHFDKLHKDVLKAISRLDCSPDFYRRNFAPVTIDYQNGKGGWQKAPAYRITRDGFVFLCGGFTGKKAAQFKEAYIAAFNDMEARLHAQAVAPAPALPKPAYMREPWFAVLRHAEQIMTRAAIARALCLSRSTVSQVLNGTGRYGSGKSSTLRIARRVKRVFCELYARHRPAARLPTRAMGQQLSLL